MRDSVGISVVILSQNRFEPQSLLCTDPARDPTQIVTWFVRRWQVEVTFQEARAHLGVETQQQWSDKATARTTPCLLALFSIVTLLATRLTARERRPGAATVWYPKSAAHLLRCSCCRSAHDLAPTGFVDVTPRGNRKKRQFRLPPAWAYTLYQAA